MFGIEFEICVLKPQLGYIKIIQKSELTALHHDPGKTLILRLKLIKRKVYENTAAEYFSASQVFSVYQKVQSVF